jgi:hypothetical protein
MRWSLLTDHKAAILQAPQPQKTSCYLSGGIEAPNEVRKASLKKALMSDRCGKRSVARRFLDYVFRGHTYRGYVFKGHTLKACVMRGMYWKRVCPKGVSSNEGRVFE